MFKTETHLHTSEISRCGHIEAKEMIRLYKEKGYSTVFVSDHFYKRFFEELGNIAWCEKTEAFLKGYYNAKEEGERLGINVLMSAELRFDGEPNDFLLYGIDADMLKQMGEIYKLGIKAFREMTKGKIMIVQAHPVRGGACVPCPLYVDALEISNTNPRHFAEEDYELSRLIAKKYGIAVSGGSDAHRLEDVGLGGVMSETEIKTAEDYIALVKSGKARVIV